MALDQAVVRDDPAKVAAHSVPGGTIASDGGEPAAITELQHGAPEPWLVVRG
jgi:hypothetical protein